jgi:hypothetical protein
MTLDYATLDSMRQSHPAWRLLCAAQAPLVASFLHRVFIVPNVRFMSEPDLAEALEDELYSLRLRQGDQAFPKSARDYLNDWAANDKGWLRKFYRQGSDEPHFDLTPSTEKAISWLLSLTERSFVGTESRLLTLFELLKQISQGAETDPTVRIAELIKKRDEIDAEIGRMHLGDFSLLDDAALRDRFQQFVALARELLTDFREVEQNFRGLDRRTREQIALWDGSKGQLLEEIMGKRDAISDSDQGHSFRAFWDFLMSSRRQEELTQLLERVLSLPAVATLQPDSRLRRIHYDWLDAGEHTQRTVAQLSQQLRRFLDDAVWLENRRIMDILREIEIKAIELRSSNPIGDFMTIDEACADIDLPFERPLHSPAVKARITEIPTDADAEEIDAAALFAQQVVDAGALAKHIRNSLQERSQVTLRELLLMRPLEHGLAELMVYMQLAVDTFEAVFEDDMNDVIIWNSGEERVKQATVPRIIFVR